MTEQLAMGDYGIYVWTCFGLTFAVLAVCVAQAQWRHRKLITELKQRIRAMEITQ